MAGIFERVWQKFSRKQTDNDEDRDTASPAGKPAPDGQADADNPGEPAAESGLSGNDGSPENGATPDLYADTGITVPQLRTLSESEFDTDESPGFDPYDTGVLHDEDKKI